MMHRVCTINFYQYCAVYHAVYHAVAAEDSNVGKNWALLGRMQWLRMGSRVAGTEQIGGGGR